MSRTPPPEVVASWPPPNFDNPETRGPAGKIVSITLLVIVSVIVAIRVYTRRTITHGFGWDDILILVAYVPAAAFVAVGLVAEQHFGWGRHVWDVRPELFEGSLKLGLSSHILFDLATSFTKLSILVLVHRLAATGFKVLKIIVVVLMAFISINCVTFIIVSFLQCRPLHLYWTPSLGRQNCINEATHLLKAGIINTVTDLIVVLLPLAIIRRLRAEDRISPRQSLIVAALFAAGLLASAAGAARTYFTWVMTTHPDHDKSWRAWLTWLSSVVELLVGIAAASAPATKPFFVKYVPRLVGAAAETEVREGRPFSEAASISKSSLAEAGHGKSKEFQNSRGHRRGRSSVSGGDSLSTIREADETSRWSAWSIPQMAEAKRLTPMDLNKPLPVIKPSSVYTIPIRLDLVKEGGGIETPEAAAAAAAEFRREICGSRGSDGSTTAQQHAQGRSFV